VFLHNDLQIDIIHFPVLDYIPEDSIDPETGAVFVRDLTLQDPEGFNAVLDIAPVFDTEEEPNPRLATTNNVQVICGNWNPAVWIIRYFPEKCEIPPYIAEYKRIEKHYNVTNADSFYFSLQMADADMMN